jgi:hypothetical protein
MAAFDATWGILPTSPLFSHTIIQSLFQVFLVELTVGIRVLRFDHVHFQGYPIRSVSCYALLS